MQTTGYTNPGRGRSTSLSSDYRKSLQRVHRQHVEIGKAIADLASRLAALSGTTSGEARGDVAGRLTRLQSTLAEHFAEEERLGFVPHALETAPQLTKRARHILSQHDLLRLDLAEVVGTLERDSSNWEEVREGFADFTESLQAHERTENELINEALMDDSGGGG